MKDKPFIKKNRATKETDISINLGFCDGFDTSFTDEVISNVGDLSVNTPVPFFTHMLVAMLFHGGWTGTISATGDSDIDDHHLVEDVGIVFGELCAEYAFISQPIARFGHSVIPMDDALAECTIDFSNRSYLSYHTTLPQARVGTFDVSLVREFFTSFTHNARINLHIESRYGINSHHIVEAMFKSCGKALRQALQTIQNSTIQSTKGSL